MRVLIVLSLIAAASAAVPNGRSDSRHSRIIGGEVTAITNYPSIAALLFSWGTTGHSQSCGGSILNQRSILSAAHCFEWLGVVDLPHMWRVRLGSTQSNSGGIVYDVSQIIMHPNFDIPIELDNDIAILRLSTNVVYGVGIQPASIAGTNYNLADNTAVFAAGWGTTEFGGLSPDLRHVQVYTVNQAVCTQRYGSAGYIVTNNMLCSGLLDVGGRDQCQGDSGGPLYHNNVVVGVCSWGIGCALPFYPGVNARVSSFTTWLQANA